MTIDDDDDDDDDDGDDDDGDDNWWWCFDGCWYSSQSAGCVECWNVTLRFEMESQADFDGGLCCVARADPMFFKPDERMTCEYVDLNEVEFEYVENEELIAHIIEIRADVPKIRV